MKNIKKLGALLLALVLVLSLGATAFADSDLAGDGVDGSKTATESSTKVTLYKELTVFNPSAAAVNAPTISYAYEIAGAAGGSTITDADGISAVTYDGVGSHRERERLRGGNEEHQAHRGGLLRRDLPACRRLPL